MNDFNFYKDQSNTTKITPLRSLIARAESIVNQIANMSEPEQILTAMEFIIPLENTSKLIINLYQATNLKTYKTIEHQIMQSCVEIFYKNKDNKSYLKSISFFLNNNNSEDNNLKREIYHMCRTIIKIAISLDNNLINSVDLDTYYKNIDANISKLTVTSANPPPFTGIDDDEKEKKQQKHQKEKEARKHQEEKEARKHQEEKERKHQEEEQQQQQSFINTNYSASSLTVLHEKMKMFFGKDNVENVLNCIQIGQKMTKYIFSEEECIVFINLLMTECKDILLIHRYIIKEKLSTVHTEGLIGALELFATVSEYTRLKLVSLTNSSIPQSYDTEIFTRLAKYAFPFIVYYTRQDLWKLFVETIGRLGYRLNFRADALVSISPKIGITSEKIDHFIASAQPSLINGMVSALYLFQRYLGNLYIYKGFAKDLDNARQYMNPKFENVYSDLKTPNNNNVPFIKLSEDTKINIEHQYLENKFSALNAKYARWLQFDISSDDFENTSLLTLDHDSNYYEKIGNDVNHKTTAKSYVNPILLLDNNNNNNNNNNNTSNNNTRYTMPTSTSLNRNTNNSTNNTNNNDNIRYANNTNNNNINNTNNNIDEIVDNYVSLVVGE